MRWISHVVLTLSSLPLAAQEVERYTLSGEPAAIYNLAGEVRVEPASGPAVMVEVTRGGRDARKLRVHQVSLDDREVLSILYPDDRIIYPALSHGSSTQLRVREDGTFNGDDHDSNGRRGRRVTIAGAGGGLEAHADLRVRVPRGSQVCIELAAGRVAVTNVEGELHIDTHSAPVTATSARGELSIDVGSGDVRISGADGELSIDTGSGSVEVSRFRGRHLQVDTGSGDVRGSDLESAELTVETGSGEIGLSKVTAPIVALETGSGSVTADLAGEVQRVAIETGSGNVTVSAPSTLSAQIDIETASGDIQSDFPVEVTRHARDHMVGSIGGGRGRLDVETGSGQVRLVRK